MKNFTAKPRALRRSPSGRSRRIRPSLHASGDQDRQLTVPRVEPDPPTGETAGRVAYDGNSAFLLYVRDITETPLLTPQEEIALAKKIRRGNRSAREQMIKANLRLVIKIAREYEDYGLPLLDLINEGNMGLMKAVDRFDPSKGAKLSTYAAWWIKQSIKRALANQGKTIRLPVHLVDKIAKMRRVALQLQDLLGREATDEELADELETTPSKVALMRRSAVRPASLDAPLSDDSGASRLAEIISDDQAQTAYEELSTRTRHEMVRDLLPSLDQRELSILQHRFGLDGSEERTLEEVGEMFGVTRERIRQLQNAALEKLRKRIDSIERLPVAA